jgi:hypothetical protein
MAGYTRQDSTGNIANGNVIDADDFDLEYNAIEAAFNASTGHKHDGTEGGGAGITALGSSQEVTITGGAIRPASEDVTVDLGAVGVPYNEAFIKKAVLSGPTDANQVTLAVAGKTTISGLTTLASDLQVAGSTILTGDFTLDDDTDVEGSKFLVEYATGNTSLAGTLTADGNTTLLGTLDVAGSITGSGNFTIDNGADPEVNKFTVAAATGNTVAEGTLAVTGAVTAKAGIATGVLNTQATPSVIEGGDSSIGGTLVVYDVLTADAGINVDNINIDGTTEGATIALTTGDLLFDIAGDAIVDVNGSDIIYKTGGIERFKHSIAADNKIEQYVWDTLAAGGPAWVKISTTTKTGTTVHGTLAAEGNTSVTGTLAATGAVSTTDTTASSSTTTGSLTVAGGAGIVGAVNIGGAVGIDGALTVAAASTFSNNLTIAGDLTVSGTTTTVNSTTVSIADPQFKLASGNSTADGIDFGTYGTFTPTNEVQQYAGWFRDADDSGKIKFYKATVEPSSTTIDTTDEGFSLADVQAETFTGALSGNATTATNLAATANIALTGTVVGNVDFDGSGDVSISTTLGTDAITLGTNTTGNYVASIAGTANEVEVTGTAAEGATFTVGLPDDVTIGNDLTVTNNLAVTGTSTLTGDVTTSGALALNGATHAFEIEAAVGNKLLFKYNGATIMSLSSTGDLIVAGNITGFGTP